MTYICLGVLATRVFLNIQYLRYQSYLILSEWDAQRYLRCDGPMHSDGKFRKGLSGIRFNALDDHAQTNFPKKSSSPMQNILWWRISAIHVSDLYDYLLSKTEVPRDVRNSKVRKQDKLRRNWSRF